MKSTSINQIIMKLTLKFVSVSLATSATCLQELLDVYLAPLSKAGLPPLALQEDEEAGPGDPGQP